MAAAAFAAWHVYRRRSPFGPAIWLTWRIVRLYVNVWCRLRRDGPCTLPRSGGVILAANHTSGLDPLCIYGTCRYRIVSFMVEKKYYDLPVVHWFQKLVGCIPIDRAKPAKSTVVEVLRRLRDGGCLGIFPQGTFERPEESVEGKTGVAMFALRTGATVIPCHISGTRYFDSIFASFFFRQSVCVKYGPPVDLSPYAGRARDKQALEEASELIMRKIRELAPPKKTAAEGAQN
jgi:1-acyl-sn-glycerol-3-phosphate acyltransferase